MSIARKLVVAAFFVGLVISGTTTRAAARDITSCAEAYPTFCFDNEPFTWCNDENCADPEGPYYLPPGFNADCLPEYYESCGDYNPDWCNDMESLCEAICWGSEEVNKFGTGVHSFSCSQIVNCEATCECWYCIET